MTIFAIGVCRVWSDPPLQAAISRFTANPIGIGILSLVQIALFADEYAAFEIEIA